MRFGRPAVFGLLWWLLLCAVAFPGDDLYGTVVVIDPGHGGQDPGSHGVFDGDAVYEDEYTYDVALRLRDLIKKEQGIAVLTTEDPEDRVREWHPSRVFPPDQSEVFALDKTRVRARTVGMRKRLAYANQIKRRYPKHRVVFIAIHFDVVGRRKDVVGVQVITPRRECPLAAALAKEFDERMRSEHPIAVVGREARNLYILNGSNSIKEKVLIELGNFNNPGDLWRIRNPEIRQDYAKRIVKALTARRTR